MVICFPFNLDIPSWFHPGFEQKWQGTLRFGHPPTFTHLLGEAGGEDEAQGARKPGHPSPADSRQTPPFSDAFEKKREQLTWRQSLQSEQHAPSLWARFLQWRKVRQQRRSMSQTAYEKHMRPTTRLPRVQFPPPRQNFVPAFTIPFLLYFLQRLQCSCPVTGRLSREH